MDDTDSTVYAMVIIIILAVVAFLILAAVLHPDQQVTLTVLEKNVVGDKIGNAHYHVGTDKGDYETSPQIYSDLQVGGTYVVTSQAGSFWIKSVDE